jgi:hypothetical protein
VTRSIKCVRVKFYLLNEFNLNKYLVFFSFHHSFLFGAISIFGWRNEMNVLTPAQSDIFLSDTLSCEKSLSPITWYTPHSCRQQCKWCYTIMMLQLVDALCHPRPRNDYFLYEWRLDQILGDRTLSQAAGVVCSHSFLWLQQSSESSLASL